MQDALLTFKGINYRADIWLNGEQIANATYIVGSFRTFDIDVSQKIYSTDINTLALRIQRPSRNNDFPYKNPNIDLAFTYVDWAPYPPDANMGIWRAVELNFHDANIPQPLLRYIAVNTILKENNTEAELSVYFEANNYG